MIRWLFRREPNPPELAVRPARGKRAENAARVLELRERGLTHAEISAVTGLARATVRNYISDPDGNKEKRRKDSYRGRCEGCGNPTDGSNGPKKAPRLCATCFAAKQHDEREWTPERIVAEIRAFAAHHGRQPTASEWLHASASDYPEGFAHVSVVQREFGSWNAAIEAAGFKPTEIGRYERTPEVRANMSAAQRGRRGTGNNWGQLTYLVSASVDADMYATLDALNGASRAEHVRRAIAAYLEIQR